MSYSSISPQQIIWYCLSFDSILMLFEYHLYKNRWRSRDSFWNSTIAALRLSAIQSSFRWRLHPMSWSHCYLLSNSKTGDSGRSAIAVVRRLRGCFAYWKKESIRHHWDKSTRRDSNRLNLTTQDLYSQTQKTWREARVSLALPSIASYLLGHDWGGSWLLIEVCLLIDKMLVYHSRFWCTYPNSSASCWSWWSKRVYFEILLHLR